MGRTVTISPQQVEAIKQTVRDYYEGWFEGDPDRMSRCLHPRLAKRNIIQPDRFDSALDEDDWQSMVEGARKGQGTKYRGTPFHISILDATSNMASVRVEGGPYIDLLHLGRFGDSWRIVNVLWEPRPAAAEVADH